MSAIVTEIILIYLLVGAIAAKHFWYLEDFFESELLMYLMLQKLGFKLEGAQCLVRVQVVDTQATYLNL